MYSLIGDKIKRTSDGAIFIQADGLICYEEYKIWLAAGNMPNKSQEQISKELELVLDQHIESVAKADKWDSRITCTMRAGYPNPWQTKAIAFGQWMDACYAHCIQVQADVIAGTRPVTTSAELIAELPIMVWPA